MKIQYTVKFEIELDDSEVGSEKPKDLIERRLDEDAIWLFEESIIDGHKVGKVTFTEKDLDDEEDDDGLTEIDEADLSEGEIF